MADGSAGTEKSEVGVPFPSKDLDKSQERSHGQTDWTNAELFEAKSQRIYFSGDRNITLTIIPHKLLLSKW